MMRIPVIFFGNADYSVLILRALVNDHHYEIVAVVTEPDKPVGRKHILTATPVKQAARELNLPVFEDCKNLPQAKVGVLIAYGKILPKQLVEAFPAGIVNIHPSLLPAWRGPAPVQYSLLHGDTTTGVSLMLLDAGMDTGPLLAQQAVPVNSTATSETLYHELFTLGANMLLHTLPDYLTGKIQPQPQSSTGASYSHIITREVGQLHANDSAQMLWNKFRAFHPWPGVFCVWQDKRIKILKAHWDNNEFMIDEVQLAGKTPTTFKDFKNGYQQFSLTDII